MPWTVSSPSRPSTPPGTANAATGTTARCATCSPSTARRTPTASRCIAGGRDITYAEVDARGERLALNLLDLGLRPLDRVVVQLPNVARVRLPLLRAAEDRRDPDHGAAAAPLPRDRASSCSSPTRSPASCRTARSDVRLPRDRRPRPGRAAPALRLAIVDGPAPDGLPLAARPARPRADRDRRRPGRASRSTRPTPRVFQLSGGTTGIPKLIPRTHNDYVYNSKAGAVGVRRPTRRRRCLLDVLPIAHNLPLACPGMQGFWFAGARVVLHPSTRGPAGVPADRAAPGDAHPGRAGAADPLAERPGDPPLRPVVGARDPERRPAAAARDPPARARS